MGAPRENPYRPVPCEGCGAEINGYFSTTCYPCQHRAWASSKAPGSRPSAAASTRKGASVASRPLPPASSVPASTARRSPELERRVAALCFSGILTAEGVAYVDHLNAKSSAAAFAFLDSLTESAPAASSSPRPGEFPDGTPGLRSSGDHVGARLDHYANEGHPAYERAIAVQQAYERRGKKLSFREAYLLSARQRGHV